jgi:riboflavin biosynthesis pyrimidine reductase
LVNAFEAFVARKTAEAEGAGISPLVTDVEWDGDELIAIGNDWTRRMFGGAFYLSPLRDDGLPSTSLVFVRSREGNTVAKDPSALGGGEADKHVIYEGLSRVAADAVLSGAETIRGGKIMFSIWHPELVRLRASLGLPRHPVQIVATLGRLTFDGLLFNEPSLRVVVLTVAACPDLMLTGLAARPWITPIVMPSAGDLAFGLRRLRELGIARISCVGGRTLAAQLIDAGLVQDVYLTTSAKSAGEPNTPLHSKPLQGRDIVRKRGTGSDAGVTFQHVVLPTRPTRPTRPT